MLLVQENFDYILLCRITFECPVHLRSELNETTETAETTEKFLLLSSQKLTKNMILFLFLSGS